MKKRILALLLAMILSLSVLVPAYAADDEKAEFGSMLMGSLFARMPGAAVIDGYAAEFVAALMTVDYLLAEGASNLDRITFAENYYIAPDRTDGFCIDLYIPMTDGGYIHLLYKPDVKKYESDVCSLSEAELTDTFTWLLKTPGSQVQLAMTDVLTSMASGN